MKETIEVYLQGPGIAITLVKLPADGTINNLIELAREKGLKTGADQKPDVWLENLEEPLRPDSSLRSAGIKSRSRVHIHTCRQIHVTVNFNNQSYQHPFSPSATVGDVKAWAAKKFNLQEVDVSEYALQICESSDRPTEDTQIGFFAEPGQCSACFDLVPKQRVEG
jgi:hypothetical protein